MKHRRRFTLTILLAAAVLLTGAVPLAASAGPDDAVAPSGSWQPLHSGESHWYAFQYAGDGSQVDIQMRVEPFGDAEFGVWTPEEMHRWSLGLEVHPIGRGSTDPSRPDSLVWSGNFTTGGTYYVVVEEMGNQPGTSYYLLDVSGDGVTLSAAPQVEASPEPVAKAQPKVARSNPAGRLAFQTSVGGDIYTINVNGSGLQRLTDGMDPEWSPDGSEIAYTRWREPRGVWVVSADGSNEWRAFDTEQARWPSWSPDGAEILFSRQHGGRAEGKQRCFFGFCFTIPANPQWHLGVVNPGKESFREPPASQWSRAPYWSPTAAGGSTSDSRFVYADTQGLRIQSEDASVSYLITDQATDTGSVWSPTKDRIAFVRKQHDHWEIYAVDADGQNLDRLTTTPSLPAGAAGNSVSPAWSPDGQHLAFLTDRSGQWEIWVMNANGTGQKKMFKKALDGLTLDYGFVGDRAISWTK